MYAFFFPGHVSSVKNRLRRGNSLSFAWGSPKASHIKASHPHFLHFPRFRSAESPQTLVFSGVRGAFRIFRIFPVSVSNR